MKKIFNNLLCAVLLLAVTLPLFAPTALSSPVLSPPALSPPAFSDSQVKLIGNITAVKISSQQVDIVTTNGFVSIAVYSPSIIRVRIDKHKLGSDFSYAVIGTVQTTNTRISQTEKEIVITTDSLITRVNRVPFTITFSTPEGKLINQDETGLSTSWVEESVTNYKKMLPGERFIGLGEKTGSLDRTGNGYTNWNSDAYGYSINQDPLYTTFPFYIGIHDHLNYGIFLDNTYQSDFNFGASNNRFSSFGARGGELNYYFIYHSKIADIITAYTSLTGRMKLPPIWSLGYQQNRYSYYPETEVYRIAQTLREKKIPADGITLDIHYMDHYKVFTWDEARFPEPAVMAGKLKALGFKLTVIVDPGVKVEPGYGPYDRGAKQNIFAKYPDSSNYTGEVWPGWCNFPDFTNPLARAYWGNELKKFGAEGISGIWNDMNEIATWGQKMPDNILFNYDGKQASHLQARNIYGLEMARASYEGAKTAFHKRPFILSRAGYAGLQRYAALWTGDNRAEESHMLQGVRLLTSLGLTGVPFTGMDIGGFTGGASPALFAKWMQIGAFIPYFRNHTAVNTKSAEPWTFGEEVLEISRNYVNLRYKLLPYLYSSFYEATQDGLPLMRSLAIDYTHDATIYERNFENQYLFGPAFMVAPFDGEATFGRVYFPKGKWYDLYNGAVEQGQTQKIIGLKVSQLPVYVKESSIIPMQSLIQTTAEKPTDTLVIHIYEGAVANVYTYYEDDGESYAYENGAYYKRLIQYSPTNRQISLEKPSGKLESKFHFVKLVLHSFGDLSAIKADGHSLKANDEFISFIKPISKFDPQGNANPVEGEKVKSLILKDTGSQISLTY